MRLSRFAAISRLRLAIGLIALAPLLAGCAGGSGGSGGPSLGDRLFGAKSGRTGDVTGSAEYTADDFLKRGYCPPVEIRVGTEALVNYERNHDGDPAYIRYQGTIARTARECHNSGDTIQIKVGIAGRVVAGPKGGPGNIALPLRVAVVKQAGSAVFYTQAFKTPVTLAAPDFSSDYSFVTDQVIIKVAPDDRDLVIYVGFDEGKPKRDEATG